MVLLDYYVHINLRFSPAGIWIPWQWIALF